MKIPTIGRNDPCPCGSGKKFKHCCLGKENGAASSHGAASISEALREALEGRQFNSLEETQAFLNQITQQQNRQQLDEFHGLSNCAENLAFRAGMNSARGLASLTASLVFIAARCTA